MSLVSAEVRSTSGEVRSTSGVEWTTIMLAGLVGAGVTLTATWAIFLAWLFGQATLWVVMQLI